MTAPKHPSKTIPPPPKPLCATPQASLKWSDDGAPIAQAYDDIYFSVDGGLAETQAVFLHGCGLPDAWADRSIFTIGELGFGSGMNFLAAWDLWHKTAPKEARLHFISVEAFPLSLDQLTRALAHFPSLKPHADPLIAQWPDRVKGVHRLHFGNVCLTLHHNKVRPALEGICEKATHVDAWFLDGFSPAKNPDMWSPEVFSQLARLSAPHARLATFTVAGLVRRGLADAGFSVTKEPGFGRKRERLEAVYSPKKANTIAQKFQKTQPPPVIIGGGIAGASLAHGFIRRGITPTLIDPRSDTAASGNPAGLVMPKLDLQDRPESRFYNAAFLYASNLYRAQNLVQNTGVLHLATNEKEQDRFAKIYAHHALPLSHMQAVSSKTAQELLGVSLTSSYDGLHFPQAQTISPRDATQKLSEDAHHIQACVDKISYKDGLWSIWDKDGALLTQTDKLFLCNGANIQNIWPNERPLDVRFTRGQLCWHKDIRPLNHAFIAGNYAIPYQDGMLLGATHDHVGAGENAELQASDTVEIIEKYAALFTGDTIAHIKASDWQARAAVRVTTRNTLPIATHVKNQKEHSAGFYVLSGLGSRGLMMAPLLAEYLVCQALGEPSPLDAETAQRFGPPFEPAIGRNNA